MAEVAIPRDLFPTIPPLIREIATAAHRLGSAFGCHTFQENHGRLAPKRIYKPRRVPTTFQSCQSPAMGAVSTTTRLSPKQTFSASPTNGPMTERCKIHHKGHNRRQETTAPFVYLRIIRVFMVNWSVLDPLARLRISA